MPSYLNSQVSMKIHESKKIKSKENITIVIKEHK